ncbi:hypothetical protein CH271_28065 [Rhodococcus sp. 05-340-2]|nr:hypothetical protein CH271_28065 [Rhodococcus sp. 05-340-2]
MLNAHTMAAAKQEQRSSSLSPTEQGGGGGGVVARDAERLQAGVHLLKCIGLVGTVTSLESAAGGEDLSGRTVIQQLYGRLRSLDDALPPLDSTNISISRAGSGVSQAPGS